MRMLLTSSSMDLLPTKCGQFQRLPSIASRLPSIEVGSIITHLNGISVGKLTWTGLKVLFRDRSAVLRPSAGSVLSCPTISDYECHGFIVEKKRASARSVVIASRLESILVGSIITHLNGIGISDLTPTALKVLFRGRSAVLRPSTALAVC